MLTCYSCKYLCQSLGVDACLRFDEPGGEYQGTVLVSDPPEPLYEDCWTAGEVR